MLSRRRTAGHAVSRAESVQRSAKRRWFRALVVVTATLLLTEGGARLAALYLARAERVTKVTGTGGVIYCIGDSFTYGLGVEPDEAYPKVLERLLARRDPGNAPRVVNYGLPGLSSSNALYAVARVMEARDASLILVMAGWNANDTDFARHRASRQERVSWGSRIDNLLEHSRAYSLGKQLLTHRERTLVLGDIKLVPQAPNMELYDFRAYQEVARSNLEKIARLGQDFGAPIVLLNYPYCDLPPNPYSKNEYYHVIYGRTPLSPDDYIVADRDADEIAIHAVIRDVGHRFGIPVVDLHKAFVASGRTDLFQDDWHHPTTAGHEIIARAVLDAIGSDRSVALTHAGLSER